MKFPVDDGLKYKQQRSVLGQQIDNNQNFKVQLNLFALDGNRVNV